MVLPSLIYGYLAPQHPETLDIRHPTRASFSPAWDERGLLNSGVISRYIILVVDPLTKRPPSFTETSSICYNYRSNSGIRTELCRWTYYSLSQVVLYHY